MAEVSEKKNDVKEKNRTWWRWFFAGIIIFFIAYSTFWNFKLSFELLTALALLLFFLIYDDVKEISIGSILSIKKEVEKVAKEQEKLSTTLNTIVFTHQAQQSQNVQVTIPATETSLEKKDEPATKEIMAQLINENKEYYSLFKQWAEYSTRQNQTVAQLQDELKEAREAINRLFIEKEVAEFNNLNTFFVYNTKRLLLWLVNKGTATAIEVFSQAIDLGIAQSNISITLEVLKLNKMITLTDNTYTATQRARVFLDFIGFKEPILPTGGLLGGLYSSLGKK